jgi:hypothetical protein
MHSLQTNSLIQFSICWNLVQNYYSDVEPHNTQQKQLTPNYTPLNFRWYALPLSQYKQTAAKFRTDKNSNFYVGTNKS